MSRNYQQHPELYPWVKHTPDTGRETPPPEFGRCDICGAPLNEQGQCPDCDKEP